MIGYKKKPDTTEKAWFLVRRKGHKDRDPSAWFPTSDNALGTEKYGHAAPDWRSENSFGVEYASMKWT